MHAHSQFCWSGDNTVAATKYAINSISQEDCDEAIVIVLSDANLSRYGISPRSLAHALTAQEPKVQAYTIFIGSLDDEAQMYVYLYKYLKNLFLYFKLLKIYNYKLFFVIGLQKVCQLVEVLFVWI